MVRNWVAGRFTLRSASLLGAALGVVTFSAVTAFSSHAPAQPREHQRNLVAGVGLRESSTTASGGDETTATDYWCDCRILQTGPGGGTINIRLRDPAEKFPDRWFVAEESAKQQIFEAALAAVIANRTVSVQLRGIEEFSTVEVLYVNAS